MSSILSLKTQPKPVQQDVNQLNLSDLEFLLRTLKTVTLTGEQVEQFYNLVVKLQNQYIEQQK